MTDKERIIQLEEALEFYANPADYVAPFTGGMGRLWKDCGATARVALKEQYHGDNEIASGNSPYNSGSLVI